MQININTKISALIKENKESINAIASVAKPLEKLKNPILRNIMASRVTIGEAVKMGGTTIEKFVAALMPLGFEWQEINAEKTTTTQAPQWLLDAKENDIIRFDVRPILENGSDPLKEILHQFKEVPQGKILCIINSFIPTPLIHLLEKEKADGSYTETINDNEFHTYFLKKKNTQKQGSENSNDKTIMDDENSFENICNNFSKENTKEIDVRNLEMPLPMQTILAELEILPKQNALYIHHKRIPVYLLEDLADKDFEVHIHHIDDTNVKMLIFKKN